MENEQKAKTSLTIRKELLGQVKAIATVKDLNQSEVIESFVKYCIDNGIEATKIEWSLFNNKK